MRGFIIGTAITALAFYVLTRFLPQFVSYEGETVGLVVLALTWRFVAESRDERPRTFDIPGQLLFMTAVGAFAFAVIEGPRAGWLSGEIITLVMVAGAGLAGFIFCERRNADPMMDLGWWLFLDRFFHEGTGAQRMEGFPTRDEMVAHYEKVSGRTARDLELY